MIQHYWGGLFSFLKKEILENYGHVVYNQVWFSRISNAITKTYTALLTLSREFLAPWPSAIPRKKVQKINYDVTVWTRKMKTIFADRVPIGLFNDANLNWHMPIWGEIPIDAMLRSGFFFRKTRSVTVPRFGFSRISYVPFLCITIFCITEVNHLKRNQKISFGSKSSIF